LQQFFGRVRSFVLARIKILGRIQQTTAKAAAEGKKWLMPSRGGVVEKMRGIWQACGQFEG
jgi:hypothetical protein